MPWAPTTAQRDLLFVAVGLSGRQETPHCRRISLQQRSPPALTLVLLLLVVVPSSNVQRNRVLLYKYYSCATRSTVSSGSHRKKERALPLSFVAKRAFHEKQRPCLSKPQQASAAGIDKHEPTLYARSSLRPRDPASDSHSHLL